MRGFVFVTFASILTACGSDDSHSSQSSDALSESRWGLVASASAMTTIDFYKGHTYRTRHIAFVLLSTISNAMEIQGTYEVSGVTITFTPTESSCPSVGAASSSSFSIVDDKLELTDSTGVYSYDRIEAEQPGTTYTFGCFGVDGTFVPQSLAP